MIIKIRTVNGIEIPDEVHNAYVESILQILSENAQYFYPPDDNDFALGYHYCIENIKEDINADYWPCITYTNRKKQLTCGPSVTSDVYALSRTCLDEILLHGFPAEDEEGEE